MIQEKAEWTWMDLRVKSLEERVEKLEKEKIRAYDNGYEDGRKPNTQSNTQTHPKKQKTLRDLIYPPVDPLSQPKKEDISDREIIDVCERYGVFISEIGIKAVREIIKKASEK